MSLFYFINYFIHFIFLVEFATLTLVNGNPVFHPLTASEVTALLEASEEEAATST